MRRELAFLVATACAVVASTAVPSPTLATVPAAAIAPENAAQAVELRRVNISSAGIYRAAFSGDGELMAGSISPSNAQLRRISNGRVVANLSGSTDLYVITPPVDPFDQSSDRYLLFLPTAVGPQSRLSAFAFATRSGDSLASTVLIQGVKTRTRVRARLPEPILSLAFSPDEQLLACGGNRIYLVNTRNGRIVQQIGESQGKAASLAFSGDGRLLASASLDGVVRLWQVADGQLIRELPRQEKAALGVAFSPDGALLATVGADRLVRLWQVESGEQVRVMAGHADAVQSVAFNPGGTLLASGAMDGAIILWQVADGAPLNTLTGHSDDVVGLAFTKDGQLASASLDGTLRLWGVK